jgi:predicted DCC family thiol-disulfide oxidoreductase YuxK
MTVAIFDGRCVLCNQTKRIVNKLDWLRRVEFLDLHEWNAVQARYPSLSYDQAMGEIHVVGDDGRLLGGFWAMRRMLRDLPLGFPLWLLLHLPGMNWLGPKVYRLIARNRYAINRFFGVELEECDNDVCKIPS